MQFNLDYEQAIDFQHIDDVNEAGRKFSIITNLLNQILMVRQNAKKEILVSCSRYANNNMSKLSWENKMILLSELSGSSELMSLWQDADTAYRRVKNKQAQLLEDILLLKKQIDVIPR